ncbi:hypothetical protein MKW92_015049 [Papaver armeniacum]|nr:hypothetical protein MKW92_015049 [Papaver armeniacum]
MNIIIYLWNPATNEYMQLPKTPPSDRHDYYIEHIQCGFGYDYENGEFKVVCLTKYGSYSGRQVKRSEVHLYALGSYNWKKLESIPYTVYGQPDVAQVPVNGVIHWIAYRRKNKVILSFNFEKEIFQEIPWPKLLNEDKFEVSLCVLGRSLCIWRFNPDIGVEVWVLKECEARKSWNKLFTIDLKKHFGSVVDFVPLQSLKNGEFLFGLDTDVGFHVHQYDPKHETSRLLFVYEDKVYSSSTTVYVESLVSLNSGSYVDDIDNDVDADSDAEFEVLYDEDGSTYCEQKIIKRV